MQEQQAATRIDVQMRGKIEDTFADFAPDDIHIMSTVILGLE